MSHPVVRDLASRFLVMVAVLAACLTLRGVIGGWVWFGELTALLTLGTLLGFVLARVIPEPVVTVLQVLTLLLGINALYAGGESWFGVVPTPDSLAILQQLVQVDAVRSIAAPAPAPDTPGMRLVIVTVAAVLWWYVSFTAIALRYPALSGVGLLVVYLLPTTLSPGGVPWWWFVPGAAAFLALIAADHHERMLAWGPLARRSGPGWGAWAQAGTGATLAVLALLAAVVIPAGTGWERRPTPSFEELTRRGDQTITIVNPIQSLRGDLQQPGQVPVLHFETDDPDPGPLRLGTVDVYDGQSWAPTYGQISRSNDVNDGLPDPTGLSSATARQNRTTTITIDTLAQNWLAVPYPATRIRIDGEWLYDESTFNITGPGTSPGQSYQVDSLVLRPTAEQLRAAPRAGADFDRWRALPELPNEIFQTSQEVTAGARTDYDKAVALQNWLREDGGFRYSLDAPEDSGNDAIVDFLNERRGYCVQFASTMAVMARSEGIPARVAVGFLPGEEIAPGRWQVSRQEAHAWPELYFEGVGWVRFEPTPAQQSGAPPAWTGPEPSPTTSTAPTTAAQQPSAATQPTVPAATPTTGTGFRVPTVVLVAGSAVLAGVLLAGGVRLWRRRRRWPDTGDGQHAELAWRRLSAQVRALGLPTPDTRTVRQLRDGWLAELAAHSPDLVDPTRERLERLVDQVEYARYAPPGGLAVATRPVTRSEVDAVVEALGAGRPWWRRLLARLR